MINVIATSKIQSNYQTTIPKEIRKNYDIDKNTIVEWSIDEEGCPKINFRRKRNIKELEGLIDLNYPTNSVELKKEIYK